MASAFEILKKGTQQTKPSHLFLLRVWPDEDGNGQEKWEGKVQHVLTGETEEFNDWESLSALLQSMLTDDAAGKAGPQKS